MGPWCTQRHYIGWQPSVGPAIYPYISPTRVPGAQHGLVQSLAATKARRRLLPQVTVLYRALWPEALVAAGEAERACYFRFVEGGVKFWTAVNPAGS